MFRKRVRFSQEGLEKKSFALPYHGGMIWCEHLDAMGTASGEIQQKLASDLQTMARPSSPSAIVVVLDETRVDASLCALLVDAFARKVPHVQRLAFVGMDRFEIVRLKRLLAQEQTAFAVAFLADLEKAKAWLLP